MIDFNSGNCVCAPARGEDSSKSWNRRAPAVKPGTGIACVVVVIAALVMTGCGVLYPRGFSGQVLTDDNRVGIPCTLSLYEALDGPSPTLIATVAVTTGEKFEKQIQLKGAKRTESDELWVSYTCKGYFPRVRGFDVAHLSAWQANLVDLGIVTVKHE